MGYIRRNGSFATRNNTRSFEDLSFDDLMKIHSLVHDHGISKIDVRKRFSISHRTITKALEEAEKYVKKAA